MTNHLLKSDGSGPECGSKAARLRLTMTPDSADCKRCRKARGLGAFDDLAALRGLVVIAPQRAPAASAP